MWGWTKAGAIFCVSILLMGSKIIIHVPQGGSVVSSSGLFACSAGEVCTIEVNEQHFSETFTAIADPGYEFSNWGNTAVSICRGSSDPYCSELDRDPFSDSERGNTGGSGRSGTSLTPSFAASDYAPAAHKTRFSINSFHATRYYQVRGNNQEEVWAQLHGAANPLAMDRTAGTKPLGHASFHYRYDYQSEYGASTANCLVKSASLVFTFETVLPRLAVQAQTSRHLLDRWQPFQQLITEHEAGHHAIYRQLVTELPRVLTDIGEVPCGELDDTVKLVVADTVSEVRQASLDYDEHYGGETYIASSL